MNNSYLIYIIIIIFQNCYYLVVLPPPPSPTTADKASDAGSKPKAPARKVQNFDNEQEYQDIELTSMRRTIAKRLTQSKVNSII